MTVSFPPDTDTPGFAEENKDKPEETRLISEAAGLFSPETVAKVLLDHSLVNFCHWKYFESKIVGSEMHVSYCSMQKGKFTSTVGFEGFLQSVVCIGMAPITSFFDLLLQVKKLI